MPGENGPVSRWSSNGGLLVWWWSPGGLQSLGVLFLWCLGVSWLALCGLRMVVLLFVVVVLLVGGLLSGCTAMFRLTSRATLSMLGFLPLRSNLMFRKPS